MAKTFGDTSVRLEKATTKLVARGVARVAGEFGLVVGKPATGVTLTQDGGGVNGPWGQAQSNQNYGIAARKTAKVVIAREAIALDAASVWQVEGPVWALVRFATAGTWESQTACVIPAIDDDNVLAATAAPDLTAGPVPAVLSQQVVVTAGEATNPKLVLIELGGARG